MKTIRLFTATVVALGMLLAWTANLSAESPRGKVYALIVLDTKAPKLGDQLLKDGDYAQALLRAGIGDDFLDIKVWKDEKATSKNILDHYKTHQTGKDDTIFFFFSGHGATTEKEEDRRNHVIALYGSGKQEILHRPKLREAIEGTDARLKIILTDTCSNFVSGLKPYKADDNSIGVRAIEDRKKVMSGARKLFFEARGLVDVNGAGEGIFAWSDVNGGVFSRALPKVFAKFADDDNASWPRVYAHLHGATEEQFKEWKSKAIQHHKNADSWKPRRDGTGDERDVQNILLNQKSQPPRLFFLSGIQLGLAYKGTDDGVKILTLTGNSPLKKAGLVVGDIIIEVENKGVRTKTDFERVVDPLLDKGVTQLVFVVAREGEKKTFKVSLVNS